MKNLLRDFKFSKNDFLWDVRIIESSDNRDSDNRGPTVFHMILIESPSFS